MSLTSEETEYCKLKVNYTAEPEVIAEKEKEILKQFKDFKMPGFRKGKAPDHAIKSKYYKEIKNAVARELVAHAYDDSLFELKIKPIGYPQTNELKFDGKNFSCELLFMKKPDFQLIDIKSIEIPKPHQEKTDIELAEKMLQELRLQNGDVSPYQDGDAVQMGDKVTMDVIFEDVNENREGILYQLGSNEIPGLDNEILAMVPGEERKVTLVDGKNATVNLHMGMRTVPCALNDELAQKVGLKTLEELRRAVDGIAGNQNKKMRDMAVGNQLKAILVDKHDFVVPTWLTLMESQDIARKQQNDWSLLTDEEKSELNVTAEKNVKFALILDSIRTDHPECELGEQEVIQMLSQKLQANGVQDSNAYLQQAQKSGHLMAMVASLKNEYCFQWAVDNVKLVE